MAGGLTSLAAAKLVRGTSMPTLLWLEVDGGLRRAGSEFAEVNGEASNVTTMEVPIARTGNVISWRLWDAEAGGTCWWTGDIAPRVFHSGDTFRVKAGRAVLRFLPDGVQQ